MLQVTGAAVALMGQVSMSSGTVSYTDSGITINGNLTGSGLRGGSWSFSGTHSVTGFTGQHL